MSLQVRTGPWGPKPLVFPKRLDIRVVGSLIGRVEKVARQSTRSRHRGIPVEATTIMAIPGSPGFAHPYKERADRS